MSKKDQSSYSLIEMFQKIFAFIRYIVKFFSHKKKDDLDKTVDNLKKDYDRINKKKESRRNEDLQNRLDNLF